MRSLLVAWGLDLENWCPPKLNKNQDCRVLPLVLGGKFWIWIAAIFTARVFLLQPFTSAIFTQPFCSHLLQPFLFSHFAAIYFSHFAAIYFSHFAAIHFSHFAAIHFSHFAAIYFSHFYSAILQPFLLSHFAAICFSHFYSAISAPPFFHHIFAVFVAVLP